MKQHLIGANAIAISHLPVHCNTRIKLAKHSVDPGRTTDDSSLTGNDCCFGQTFGRDQLCSDVAAANVFG